MYKHTQTGWGIIIVMIVAMLLVYFSTFGRVAAGSFVYVVLVVALIMFAKLTITIDDDYVRLVFGLIGFPYRKFKLTDIQSCRLVKNFLIGLSLGIHYGVNGSLYNVSGRQAVELTMKNGRRVNIGTDEPEKLKAAIDEKLKKIIQ